MKNRAVLVAVVASILATVALALGVRFLGPALLFEARAGSRRATCVANLFTIGQALIRYEQATGRFPAVPGKGEDPGNTMSWRVAILPYIERQDVFNAYHDDEPWNTAANQSLARAMPFVFRCPDRDDTDLTTDYAMIAGPGALGGLADADRNADHVAALSGTSLTLLVIELPGAKFEWMDPRGPTIDEVLTRLGKRDRSVHGGAVLAVCCDGHIRTLHADLALETIRSLADPERTTPVDLSGLD